LLNTISNISTVIYSVNNITYIGNQF